MTQVWLLTTWKPDKRDEGWWEEKQVYSENQKTEKMASTILNFKIYRRIFKGKFGRGNMR